MIARTRDTADTLANEECLISSAMASPDTLDRVEGISQDSFSDAELGAFWAMLNELRNEGKPIDDPAVLMPEIRKRGINISAGMLGELRLKVPSAANVWHYRANVQESARLRKLKGISSELAGKLKDAAFSTVAIVQETLGALETLNQAAYGDDEPATIGEALELLIDDLANEDSRRQSAMTGFPTLDEYLGGMAPGEMAVLAARPSRGKTAGGLQMARHNASRGRQVMFIALEMTLSDMAKRIVCESTDIDSADLRNRNLNGSERKQIVGLYRELIDDPLTIWTPATATLQYIRQKARQQKAAKGLDLLVIDYLGLIKPDAVSARKQRWEQFTEISSGIKRLARELKTPILVLQQLNRDSDGRSPRLSDLRDSGSIEQDADAVILIDYGDKTEDETDDLVFDLAKNRHGMTGPIPMKFHKAKTRFVDARSGAWTP